MQCRLASIKRAFRSTSVQVDVTTPIPEILVLKLIGADTQHSATEILGNAGNEIVRFHERGFERVE